jgi:hypothetical protein
MDDKTEPDAGDLPARWRKEAELFRSYGQEAAATMSETHAAQLERSLRRSQEDTVTLVEGARLSGYTAEHLGKLVREGKIPNAGRTNAPRIRPADLPRKKGAVLAPRAAAASPVKKGGTAPPGLDKWKKPRLT